MIHAAKEPWKFEGVVEFVPPAAKEREGELEHIREGGAVGLINVLSKGGTFPSIKEMEELIDESKDWEGGGRGACNINAKHYK